MARNKYPGYCYCCGSYVPPGYGHFERMIYSSPCKWKIKCVKCASGRVMTDKDPCVMRIRKELEKEGEKDNE